MSDALSNEDLRRLTGDDVNYWMHNEFMPRDLIEEKVKFWVAAALDTERERIAQAIEASVLPRSADAEHIPWLRGHDCATADSARIARTSHQPDG